MPKKPTDDDVRAAKLQTLTTVTAAYSALKDLYHVSPEVAVQMFPKWASEMGEFILQLRKDLSVGLPIPTPVSWKHDGEYCRQSLLDDAATAARSVCEGMHNDKFQKIQNLVDALNEVYALAGEDKAIAKIIDDVLLQTL